MGNKVNEQAYRAYCNRCAFDEADGCMVLSKRSIPCLNKCTKKEDLNKRYNAMLLYTADDSSRRKLKREHKACLGRLTV